MVRDILFNKKNECSVLMATDLSEGTTGRILRQWWGKRRNTHLSLRARTKVLDYLVEKILNKFKSLVNFSKHLMGN